MPPKVKLAAFVLLSMSLSTETKEVIRNSGWVEERDNLEYCRPHSKTRRPPRATKPYYRRNERW